MFRQSIQKRRCLIPADGFFEWKRISDDLKIPHYIRRKGALPFWMAGIFENPTDTRPETVCLLTTSPNSLMESIHDRMPVILTGETAKRWLILGEMPTEELASLAKPFPADSMEAYPVSKVVNNARNDVPECIIPTSRGQLEL